MSIRTISLFRSVALVVSVCFAGHFAGAEESAKGVKFVRDVMPVLQRRCVECHNPVLKMGQLQLDSRASLMSSGVVVPGDSDESLLVQRTHDREMGVLMPPTGRLTKPEAALIKEWVDSGAEWPEDVVLKTELSLTSAIPATGVFKVLREGDLDAFNSISLDPALISETDRRGATPLLFASLYADVTSLRRLLEKGADPNVADSDGMTPLMMAVTDVEKVRALLHHGAKVETQSKLGRNALLLASANARNVAVVDELLRAGADVHYADRKGSTSLVLAARTGDLGLLSRLLDAIGDSKEESVRKSLGTALSEAARANDLASVRLLVERGANADQRGLDIALLFAATHGNREMSQFLITSGADQLARNSTNYGTPATPVLAATYSEVLNADVVSLLLEKEVDLQQTSKHGKTPWTMAEEKGASEILTLLRDADDGAPIALDASATTNGSRLSEAVSSAGDVEIRDLVQKSITLLQSCGPEFYAKSGCVACHQQTASTLVVDMARSRGFHVDERIAEQQTKLVAVELAKKRAFFLQRIKIGGAAHRLGYLMWGLSDSGYPADEFTDAAYVELTGLQRFDGSWFSDAHRPPTEYSPITATAVALRAVDRYAPPGMRDAADTKIERATRWLENAAASKNAEKAFRLLGLHWGGARNETKAKAARDLLLDQLPSGGWTQLPGLEADAYATGLSLYALHEAGSIDVQEEAYQSGVRFLLSTSTEDGSWHVRSRSFKFQPYFESGFPHEHDQWISAAATGWSTMALMATLDPSDSNQ